MARIQTPEQPPPPYRIYRVQRNEVRMMAPAYAAIVRARELLQDKRNRPSAFLGEKHYEASSLPHEFPAAADFIRAIRP